MRILSRLLVVRDDKLGDLCVSMAILEALQQLSPATRVTWMGRSEFFPLLEGHPSIDHLWPLPKSLGLVTRFRLILRIRALRPDASLLLRFNCQGRWRRTMTQAGVPVRVGSSEYDAGHFTHNLYRPGLEWHQRHEARKALDMLEAALGEPVPDVPARIILGPAAAELAGKTIVGFNLPERYYVLQLGMGGSSRAMSPEFFAEVARQVDLPLILTGVPSELDLETRFRALYSGTWVSVNGKTDLATLSEVVRRAQFVLSVDTGTVHIAAAVGTPSVVIMPRRCIAPGHWSPWGTPSHVIRPRSFCPGCDDWRCLDEDDRCTRTVSVEETVEACRLLLQR